MLIILFFQNLFFGDISGNFFPSESIITFLALSFIINFVISIAFKDKANIAYYSGFSVLLILIYFLLSVFELDGNVLGIMKIFYEIKTVSLSDFTAILGLALTGGFLQITLQHILDFFVKGKKTV